MKSITDEEYHNFKSYPSNPQKFYVASNTWVPPQPSKYIQVRMDARKSSFAIKVERWPKDKGPYYKLGQFLCIYAPKTRQIKYRNTKQEVLIC